MRAQGPARSPLQFRTSTPYPAYRSQSKKRWPCEVGHVLACHPDRVRWLSKACGTPGHHPLSAVALLSLPAALQVFRREHCAKVTSRPDIMKAPLPRSCSVRRFLGDVAARACTTSKMKKL